MVFWCIMRIITTHSLIEFLRNENRIRSHDRFVSAGHAGLTFPGVGGIVGVPVGLPLLGVPVGLPAQVY